MSCAKHIEMAVNGYEDIRFSTRIEELALKLGMHCYKLSKILFCMLIIISRLKTMKISLIIEKPPKFISDVWY